MIQFNYDNMSIIETYLPEDLLRFPRYATCYQGIEIDNVIKMAKT